MFKSNKKCIDKHENINKYKHIKDKYIYKIKQDKTIFVYICMYMNERMYVNKRGGHTIKCKHTTSQLKPQNSKSAKKKSSQTLIISNQVMYTRYVKSSFLFIRLYKKNIIYKYMKNLYIISQPGFSSTLHFYAYIYHCLTSHLHSNKITKKKNKLPFKI